MASRRRTQDPSVTTYSRAGRPRNPPRQKADRLSKWVAPTLFVAKCLAWVFFIATGEILLAIYIRVAPPHVIVWIWLLSGVVFSVIRLLEYAWNIRNRRVARDRRITRERVVVPLPRPIESVVIQPATTQPEGPEVKVDAEQEAPPEPNVTGSGPEPVRPDTRDRRWHWVFGAAHEHILNAELASMSRTLWRKIDEYRGNGDLVGEAGCHLAVADLATCEGDNQQWTVHIHRAERFADAIGADNDFRLCIETVRAQGLLMVGRLDDALMTATNAVQSLGTRVESFYHRARAEIVRVEAKAKLALAPRNGQTDLGKKARGWLRAAQESAEKSHDTGVICEASCVAAEFWYTSAVLDGRPKHHSDCVEAAKREIRQTIEVASKRYHLILTKVLIIAAQLALHIRLWSLAKQTARLAWDCAYSGTPPHYQKCAFIRAKELYYEALAGMSSRSPPAL